jgi:hypothetical protein
MKKYLLTAILGATLIFPITILASKVLNISHVSKTPINGKDGRNGLNGQNGGNGGHGVFSGGNGGNGGDG